MRSSLTSHRQKLNGVTGHAIFSPRRAFRLPEGALTVFVLASVCAQFLIFTFTPLATEALRQTGLSRGLLHVAPVAMLLVILLAEELFNGKTKHL